MPSATAERRRSRGCSDARAPRRPSPRARTARGDPDRARRSVRQDLDRHVAIERRVARAVDLSHASGAEGPEDLVVAEACARGEWHRAAWDSNRTSGISLPRSFPSKGGHETSTDDSTRLARAPARRSSPRGPGAAGADRGLDLRRRGGRGRQSSEVRLDERRGPAASRREPAPGRSHDRARHDEDRKPCARRRRVGRRGESEGALAGRGADSLGWPEALDSAGSTAIYVFGGDLYALDLAASRFSRLTRTDAKETLPASRPTAGEWPSCGPTTSTRSSSRPARRRG